MTLTPRQREVLRLAVTRTNKAVAAELGLSKRTVDRHLDEIFVRLGTHHRVIAAVRAGIVRIA